MSSVKADCELVFPHKYDCGRAKEKAYGKREDEVVGAPRMELARIKKNHCGYQQRQLINDELNEVN